MNSHNTHGLRPIENFFLALSLTLIAFNLRPVFSSLSVLLPEISASIGMSGLQAGILTTLPVLCLGIFAPLAPWLSIRIGVERTLFIVLVLLALGVALRGFGTLPALYVGSVFAGLAIAVGNVLLPSLVKRDFPSRLALLTGLYTMGLCGGAALAVGFTVPLQKVFDGSWQKALAFWALPAIAVGILWLPQLKNRGDTAVARRRYRVKGLLRQPLAWQVTFLMGMQSSLAYCVFGWLAPILRERGVAAEMAGMITSFSILIQVVSSLLVPILAVRRPSQSAFCVILCLLSGAGLVGLVFAPLATVWFWAAVQGIGQGGLIAMAMTLIVLRSPDPYVASHLSGMAQGIGYCLAAVGPFLVGTVHDFTGGFEATAIVFVFFAAGAAISGWLAGRSTLIPVHGEAVS